MPAEIPPQPWRSFLDELDRLLGDEAYLHCFGGFVVTLLYGMRRQTADLDVLSVLPIGRTEMIVTTAGRGSELHRKHGIYVDYVTVVTPPDDYEKRLKQVFQGRYKSLRLAALDPYDVALCKLERNIQRDRDDVKFLARQVPLNLQVLQSRYRTELRPYLSNPEKHDLTLKLWVDMIQEERDRANHPRA